MAWLKRVLGAAVEVYGDSENHFGEPFQVKDEDAAAILDGVPRLDKDGKALGSIDEEGNLKGKWARPPDPRFEECTAAEVAAAEAAKEAA